MGSCCVGDDTSSVSGPNGEVKGADGGRSIPKSSRLSARGGGRSTSASRSWKQEKVSKHGQDEACGQWHHLNP